MAMTPAEIYAGIRLGTGEDPPEPILTIINRLYGVANGMIANYLKGDVAPEDVRDQAALNIIAYIYDTNPAGSRNLYPNAMAGSGAGSLLDFYRIPRAILVGGDAEAVDSGLTPEQLALIAQIPGLIERLNIIRQVPGGGTRGEILGRVGDDPGVYGWTTIGEDQIDAAIREFIAQNPDIFTSVTPDQLQAVREALEALIARERTRIDNIDNDISGINDSITAVRERLTGVETKSGDNQRDIGINTTNIGKNTGNIETINNRLGPLTGSIAITPNTIPNAASVIGNYTFANEDIDTTWLSAQGTNQLDIWFKNTGVHAVRPYSPAQDQVIEINVNENEARAIGIGANEKIIPIRAVWRKDGQFVALKNTWLEIRELPTTDAPTIDQFNKEVAAREAGDQIQPEPITNAAGFVSFLADQERSDNVAIAHFTIAVAEDYKGVRHTYKVNDYAWFPPKSVDGKVFANIPPPAGAFSFSVDDKIEMLNLRVEPGFILYENGKLTEALTTTVRVIIDNPDRLDETLWFEGEVDGQDVVARTAWTVRTGAINFVIPVATARLIGQNDQLAFDIQFYDAANAGNLVGTRKINVPLEELPTIPPAPRPARQAVNATTANTAINPLLGAVVDLTLTASTTIAINADFNGSSLFFRVHQPSAGNRTLTLGGNMLDINTGPNTMTYIGIQRIGNSWTVIGIRKPS